MHYKGLNQKHREFQTAKQNYNPKSWVEQEICQIFPTQGWADTTFYKIYWECTGQAQLIWTQLIQSAT